MPDPQIPSVEIEKPAPSAETLAVPEVPAVERETAPERPREEAPTPAPEAEKPPPSSPASVTPLSPIPAAPKDGTTRRIESILEDDMMGLYMIMPPEVQRAFKVKGEETTGRIRALLGQAKVKAKDILKLIKDWLRLIPGVNRFFLEQEAKIKTDKIMNLRDGDSGLGIRDS